MQSEYNKMKPTGRNEFQTSNLKTAFRPGMQRGECCRGWGCGCGFGAAVGVVVHVCGWGMR